MRFKTAPVLVLAALCILLTPRARAGIVGPQFQVNTYTTYGQRFPNVSADGAGNFVIVWESYRQDGDGGGIFGRRYDSAGSPLSGEFRVNTATLDYQYGPSVGMAPAGDFIVVWSSYPSDGDFTGIFARRYNSTGTAAGAPFQVNTETADYQYGADVGVDASGNFVVVWASYDQDGSGSGIFAQRLNSTGAPQGGEFQVNTETFDDQGSPMIAIDPSGNFVVVWQSNGQDGSSFGIFGQRFSSTGLPQGGEFQVNTFTTNAQKYPDVSVDASGSFVVVWQSNGQDGSSFGIFGQRFSSTGLPQGGEFQVNTYTSGQQSFYGPRVAMAGMGEFIVVWDSIDQDGSGFGIFGQQYDETGSPHGGEFRINATTINDQIFPAVVGANGDFVVSWSSYDQDGDSYGVFAQRLCTSPTNPPGEVANLAVSPGGPGLLHLSWDPIAGASHYSVFSDGAKDGAFMMEVAGSPTSDPNLTIPCPEVDTFFLVAAGNDCGLGPK